MKLTGSTWLVAILSAGLLICGSAAAAPLSDSAKAEAMFRHYSYGLSKTESTGEQFCWNRAYGMSDFLDSYEATGDQSYLDWGTKYYDALIGKMAEGPDGYRGFIGPWEYNPKVWCDDHVGDAIIFDNILDFAYRVMRDPALKKKYGAKAMQYTEIAKKDVIEKWDSRGTFKEIGPFGFYVSWDHYGQPGQYKEWSKLDASNMYTSLTLPLNKSLDVAMVALRIWQITGEEKYKHRAEQIFGHFKSHIQQWNGCYHWNYWEPGGEWDLSGDALHPFRHWISTHPARNYQEGEVSDIVKAYNAGIVFTEADIRAIINTNLKVMWNGDKRNPQWANSNADLEQTLGEPNAYGAVPGKCAGILWGALAQFDPTERELLGVSIAAMKPNSDSGAGAKLYFQNVTSQFPVSFERRDTKEKVEIPAEYAQFPTSNVRTITFAAVLPSIFDSTEKAIVACKLVQDGELDVALYTADGKTKVASLWNGQVEGGTDGRDGIVQFVFNSTDPATGKGVPPGNYRVHWAVTGDGYREFPVTIR